MASSVNMFRSFATQATKPAFKVCIVGGGSAGITVSAQLRKALSDGEHVLKDGDVAIIEPAKTHYYQPGWTLVGGNVSPAEAYERPMSSVIPSGVTHIASSVSTFAPESNALTTTDGQTITYDYLVVAPGIEIKPDMIKGLKEALADPTSSVSSIYFRDYAPKLASDAAKLQKGKAIFTQPAGVIKCAGAPQKVMWKSLQNWREAGRRDDIDISFITGMPTMFAVPKYSQVLDALRKERGVEGLFKTDLIEIDAKNRIAKFNVEGKTLEREYDLLHAVPKMGPYKFVADSPLANEQGYVSVDDATLQHKKFPNVFSIGDASSLPTSKTIAAITGQAPVLVNNLKKVIYQKKPNATYGGYTSCPLVLDNNDVLLAEFKYGLVPDETFTGTFPGLDQSQPHKLFYQLKKNVFPKAYFDLMLKGNWYGRSGPFKPNFDLDL